VSVGWAWTVFSVICQMVPWRVAYGNCSWVDHCPNLIAKIEMIIDVFVMVPKRKTLQQMVSRGEDCKTGLEGSMSNLISDIYPVMANESQPVSALLKVEQVDVSDCSGLTKRFLPDSLG